MAAVPALWKAGFQGLNFSDSAMKKQARLIDMGVNVAGIAVGLGVYLLLGVFGRAGKSYSLS